MGGRPNGIMATTQLAVSEERSIYQAVIEAIADAEGIDPPELTPPLFEVLEPEALDTLFARNQALGKVIFNYNGYEVSVFPDGFVSIEGQGT